MIRVALVGTGLAAQFAERPSTLDGIEVANTSASFEVLMSSTAPSGVDAVVLELSALGDEPRARLDQIFSAIRARLVVITYHFARREVLGQLTEERVRLLQSPASLASIRSSMLSLIIGNIFASQSARGPSPRERTERKAEMTQEGPSERRFTPEQLARLLEISSTIQCECPNHLSRLVSQLIAFEDYAERCQSTSPSDRDMHLRLYQATSLARAKMEEALAVLLVYERIKL